MTQQASDPSELLRHARQHGTPIIEGDAVTFLWEGESPPRLSGDFTHWEMDQEALDLEPLAPGLWGRTIRFPMDAYLEYGFVRGDMRMPDPLNPSTLEDGVGHTNSSFRMPEAVDSPLAQVREGVARGTISTHRLSGLPYIATPERTVRLYDPPVAGPHPLLVVYDGGDYLERAHLATIVDNLIAERRIRPIAMALADHGETARIVEYACSDATVGFVLHAILPLARDRLDLIDITANPGAFGIMGASMGGLMSLYTAHRLPEIFGRVFCQSGAFGANRLYGPSVLNDLIWLGAPPPLKIWMDCAAHEWFLEPDREMLALLRERGYDVEYMEHQSGHNYVSWRMILEHGLEHLFSPEA